MSGCTHGGAHPRKIAAAERGGLVYATVEITVQPATAQSERSGCEGGGWEQSVGPQWAVERSSTHTMYTTDDTERASIDILP